MIVELLNQDELDELLALYRSTPGNYSLQVGADGFRERCQASINRVRAQIYVSDGSRGRVVSIAPRVFTLKVRFPENDKDTIVGCVTAFDASVNGLVIEDLSLMDLTFAAEMHFNRRGSASLAVFFLKELISVLYHTFMPRHNVGLYFLDGSVESERTGNILEACHFRRQAQANEQLIFIEPVRGYPMPDGGDQLIRDIAHYVLDVQRAIDSKEGTLREFLLSSPNKR